MTFEEWWKERCGNCSQAAHKLMEEHRIIAGTAWNAAIESIRTTERIPVSERLLAAVLRIETRLNQGQPKTIAELASDLRENYIRLVLREERENITFPMWCDMIIDQKIEFSIPSRADILYAEFKRRSAASGATMSFGQWCDSAACR